jgi:hypothetical protein
MFVGWENAGRPYHCCEIDSEVVAALMAASAKGTYHSRNIGGAPRKGGPFDGRDIRSPNYERLLMSGRRRYELCEPMTIAHIRGHGASRMLVYCNSIQCIRYLATWRSKRTLASLAGALFASHLLT